MSWDRTESRCLRHRGCPLEKEDECLGPRVSHPYLLLTGKGCGGMQTLVSGLQSRH